MYIGPNGGLWGIKEVAIANFTKTEHWERIGFLANDATAPSTGGTHCDDAEA
jgi:hypothetical protein